MLVGHHNGYRASSLGLALMVPSSNTQGPGRLVSHPEVNEIIAVNEIRASSAQEHYTNIIILYIQ